MTPPSAFWLAMPVKPPPSISMAAVTDFRK